MYYSTVKHFLFLRTLFHINSPFSSSQDTTVQNLDFTRQTTDININI